MFEVCRNSSLAQSIISNIRSDDIFWFIFKGKPRSAHPCNLKTNTYG